MFQFKGDQGIDIRALDLMLCVLSSWRLVANLELCGSQKRGTQARGRHLVSGGDLGSNGKGLPEAVANLDELFLVHRDLKEHSKHRGLIAFESSGALPRVCLQSAFGCEFLKADKKCVRLRVNLYKS